MAAGKSTGVPGLQAKTRRPTPRDEGFAAVENGSGEGAFVIVCEHASNHVPPEYEGLGLDEAALVSHIAWDPGALEIARKLAHDLDAALVHQRASRLLYDCNRPPESPAAVPQESEIYRIPGNVGLSPEARKERIERFYLPFLGVLSRQIDDAVAGGKEPVIVTVHTFTPVFHGARRQVEIGILCDDDDRLAAAMIEVAGGETGTLRLNEPYGPRDGVTHTLREHALSRGLLNVMIEVRSDLVADRASQVAMGARIGGWIGKALATDRCRHGPGGARRERSIA